MKCKSIDWLVMLAIQELNCPDYNTYSDVAVALGLDTSEKGWRCVERLYRVGLLPSFVREEFRKLMFEEDTFVTWKMVYMLYRVYNEEYTTWPCGDGPLFTQLWGDYVIGVRT